MVGYTEDMTLDRLCEVLHSRYGRYMPAQDSERDQLDRVWEVCLQHNITNVRDAHRIANAMGEYDAADVIRRWCNDW